MKTIKNFVAVSALALVSFGSFAQSVTATASTLDSAEAQIAAKAQQNGERYTITETTTNNFVHMTAELHK